jgi:proliferating cell nuclear antigen
MATRKKQKTDEVVVRMRTSEGSKIKSLFERLSTLVDCCLDFRPDGIYTSAIEVNMIYFSLSLKNLDDYVCTRNLVCGIQAAVWWKCLKHIGQNDTLEILVTEEDVENCRIQLRFIKNNNRGTTQYYLHQMNIEYERIDLPDKEFESILSLPANEFQKALRSCGDAKNVRLSSGLTKVPDEADPEKTVTVPELIIEAADDSACSTEPSVCVRMIIDGCLDEEGKQIDFSDHAFCNKKEWFSLSALSNVSKSASMSTNASVTIYLSEQFPLLLDYTVGTLGNIRYAIAPKIDIEDDGNAEYGGISAESGASTIVMRTSAYETRVADDDDDNIDARSNDDEAGGDHMDGHDDDGVECGDYN